jgi:mycothiol synthase
MTHLIREFTAKDYETVVAVHNAVYPDYIAKPSDWRHWDDHREAKIRWRRYVAEREGVVVGWGTYANSSWTFHPRKFWLEVGVHPEYRGQGIGRTLYEHLVASVAEHEPIVFRSEVREDNELGRSYAESRGYCVDQREQESRLDISAFDAAAFAADLKRVEDQGIAIRSWSEIKDLPDAERRFHELGEIAAADVPSSDPHTPSEFKDFRKRVLRNPNFLPDLNLIAMDGEKLVGLSNLWREATKGRVETGLTGVHPDYRKRGLATAMKVKALAAAKTAGFEATLTWNEENNHGMLGINRRLGFQVRPAWLMIENILDAEALAETLKEEP